jgi:hypothetical protein
MSNSQGFLDEIRDILKDFEKLDGSDIRQRVCALVPAYDTLRNLGKTLLPKGLNLSARERLLAYFQLYPQTVIHEKELAIVAGISEWARRVRELRVQYGWKIITGMTVRQLADEGEISSEIDELGSLSPNDYCLIDINQDRDAAHRWNVANEIRKGPGGSREKILKYLRSNVSKVVTGEELSYVAKSSEWARRTRELRTEDGWPISTKMSGNPSLAMGEYILEEDRQAPTHDRHINEATRRESLRRDGYECQKCGWSHDEWNKSDPRFLELHHVEHHADGGSNEMENLITYCNVCHDEIHKVDKHR